MRMFRVVLVGLALALAGCGSDDGDEAAPATTTTQSDAAATTTTSAAETTPLDGTWRTEPITVDDMAKTLQEQGLGKWVDDFEKSAPISDAPTSLILDVKGDWDLSGQAEGGGPRLIDYDAEYEVEGDTVVVTHGDGSSNAHRWSLDGDVLSLTWLEGDAPAYKGIPDEVFQTALYMTADFERS